MRPGSWSRGVLDVQKGTCLVAGCNHGCVARHMCDKHYRRWLHHKNLDDPQLPSTKHCRSCDRDLPRTPTYFASKGMSRKGTPMWSSRCRECIGTGFGPSGRLLTEDERIQARRRGWRRRARLRRLDAIAAYGGRCACCGEQALPFLVIDHVQNDGNLHRKTISDIYTYLRMAGYPQDGRFQVLCHNCNMAKALYGACPHVSGLSLC